MPKIVSYFYTVYCFCELHLMITTALENRYTPIITLADQISNMYYDGPDLRLYLFVMHMNF